MAVPSWAEAGWVLGRGHAPACPGLGWPRLGPRGVGQSVGVDSIAHVSYSHPRYYRVLCVRHAEAVHLCHERSRTVAGMHQVALGRLGSMHQGPRVALGDQTLVISLNPFTSY